MKLSLTGRYRDTFTYPTDGGEGVPLRTASITERPNAVVFRALDLIAGLLRNEADLGGIMYWAVGAGDPGWDTETPAPDRKTTRLTNETFRKPVDPARDIAYDPETNTITVGTTFAEDEAVGVLREFGLFGGNASARPDSGYLINHGIHPAIEKTNDARLEREVRLTLASEDATSSGLDLVGLLLANRPGLAGIQHWAAGGGDPAWDATPPGEEPDLRQLVDETYRRPVDPRRDMSYHGDTRTLVVRTTLDYNEATNVLREQGLFGGDASREPGSGHLISYEIHPSIDKTRPLVLEREFRIVLGSDIVVTVPDLAGMTGADAQSAIEALGLTFGLVGEAESDVEPGSVIEQEPVAGSLVAEGTVVSVTVAVAARISVPNLVGLVPEEAGTVLDAAGLVLSADEPTEEEHRATPGTIVRQIPAAGQSVAPGSAVQIVLARPVTTEAPDLAGLSAGEAAVVAGKFNLALAPPPHPTIGATAVYGTVVEQSPAAGERVTVRTEIVVTLAAPWSVMVPDVTGQTAADAASTLRAAAAELLAALERPDEPPGLAIGSQTLAESDAHRDTIVSQDPASGAQAPLYGTVDITVAIPVTAEAPVLIGLTLDEATVALEAAGLMPGTTVNRKSVAPAGSVIVQEPAAAVRVARGGAVNLTLAEPFQVDVPLLLEHPLAYAQEVVASRGLVLGEPSRRVSDHPVDTVIEQQPEPGVLVALNSTVEIVIASAASGDVETPSVVGLSIDEARAILEAAGLGMEVTGERPSTETAGTILEQSPQAGEQVAQASVAFVTVASPMQAVGEITGALGSEPDGLYIHGTMMRASGHVLQALYDGPFDQRRFQYQPVILHEIPVPEIIEVVVPPGARFVRAGRIVTAPPIRPTRVVQMQAVFRLRDDLRWDDGEPVTAEDSVFSFKLAADPATPLSKLRIDRTQSYEAVDDFTIVWTGLPGWVDAAFIHNFWTPLPRHQLAGQSPEDILRGDFARRPMGYGPYQVGDWVEGERIVLERHPAYFRASESLPQVERLDLRFFQNTDEVFERILAGELDMALNGSLGPQHLPKLLQAEQQGNIRVHAELGNAQEYLMFNFDRERTPFLMDLRVRQAIAFGIDRNRIIEEILNERSPVGDTFVPPGHPMHADDLTRYEFKPDTARRLLAEAGFPNGFRVSLLVPEGKNDRLTIAEMIANDLAELGIGVSIESVLPRKLFAKGQETPLFGRQFEMALVGWTAGVEPPGEMFLSEEISGEPNGWGGPNIAGYGDKRFDAAALAAMSEPDPDSRRRHWAEAQRVFADSLPAIPLFQHLNLAVTRADLGGLQLDPSQPSEMWNVERFG